MHHNYAINGSGCVFHVGVNISQTLYSVICSQQPQDKYCFDAHFTDGETEAQHLPGVRRPGAELGLTTVTHHWVKRQGLKLQA